jgi:hypothetical protein
MTIDVDSLSQADFGYLVGYIGMAIALALIPTWIAIYRRHRQLPWLILANAVCGFWLIGKPPLSCLVWIAILVWAIAAKKQAPPLPVYQPLVVPQYPEHPRQPEGGQ